MIIPKNGYISFQPILRKEKEVYVEGYTTDNMLCSGFYQSQKIAFIPNAIIQINDYYLVKEENILSKGQELTKPSVIVKPKTIEQKLNKNISTREQEFFEVIQSSIGAIPEKSIIIIRPYTAILLEEETQTYIVLQPNIVLVIANDIQPGPDYVLKRADDQILFSRAEMDIQLVGQEIKIIKKDNVYSE